MTESTVSRPLLAAVTAINMGEFKWRTIRDSAGFHGVPNIAQEAADVHCARYGHSPCLDRPVVIGVVDRCTACGRSIAFVDVADG